MKLFTGNDCDIYESVNLLHKDHTDAEIIANYKTLADKAGYVCTDATIDRTNAVAPTLKTNVYPKGAPKNDRSFTITLLANTANIGVIFPYNGENHILVRVQDKAGYFSAVSVPGGHRELVDNDISETARRELLEEVQGVYIPSGSKYWVGACTSVSLCNNATNTDTESLIWVNPEKADDFVQSVDWNKWQAIPVQKAPALVTHGSSKPVALSALVFELGGSLEGVMGTIDT